MESKVVEVVVEHLNPLPVLLVPVVLVVMVMFVSVGGKEEHK
jgi:hypothetical protein